MNPAPNPAGFSMMATYDLDDPTDLEQCCKHLLKTIYPAISTGECQNILRTEETLWDDLRTSLGENKGHMYFLEKASTVYEKIRAGHLNPPPPAVTSIPEPLPEEPEIILFRIQTFIEALRPVFESFVDKEEPLKAWCPPDGDLDFTWFKTQKIPSSAGRPDLLLHRLGSFSENPDLRLRLDSLFPLAVDAHTFLVNTSGSGKTKLMLEGLCLHWGFYFASVVDSSSLGSCDVENAIQSYIPDSPGFVEDVSTFARFSETTLALEQNRRIAAKRFTELLLARLIIFELFIDVLKERLTNVAEAKKLWLLLQLHPSRLGFSGGDFFDQLTFHLRNSPADFVRIEVLKRFTSVSTWCNSDQVERGPFFVVLDEAQHAARGHFSAFRSEKKQWVHRPILRELVRAWLIIGVWLIISGTGIDREVITKVLASAVLKPTAHRLLSDVGGFTDSAAHANFIARYIPPRILQTPSGAALIKRMIRWLHGRHRFTTTFLSELLFQRFRRPHQLLNAFIKHYTTITPTDGQEWLAGEPDDCQWPDEIQGNAFDFAKLTENQDMVDTIIRALNTNLIRSGMEDHVIFKEKLFVEYGFARYIESSTKKIVMDEPLVLLAASTIARSHQWFSERVHTRTDKSNGLEDYLALALPYLFEAKPRLDQVFDFAGIIPSWSSCRAELVSLHHDEWPTTAPTPQTSTVLPSARPCFSYGTNAGADPFATLDWLRHSEPTFTCFPPIGMGPDLIFVLRILDASQRGSLLWVALQAKYSESGPRLTTKTVRGAIRSVTPTKFWIDKNEGHHASAAANPHLVRDTLRALRDLPDRLPNAGDYSLLRVVAAFPVAADIERVSGSQYYIDREGKHPLASLNREFLANATAHLPPVGKIASLISLVVDSNVVVDADSDSADEIESNLEINLESDEDVAMPVASTSKHRLGSAVSSDESYKPPGNKAKKGRGRVRGTGRGTSKRHRDSANSDSDSSFKPWGKKPRGGRGRGRGAGRGTTVTSSRAGSAVSQGDFSMASATSEASARVSASRLRRTASPESMAGSSVYSNRTLRSRKRY